MKTTHEKNIATFIHLSSLSQYCIPFGNFIFPILIWSTNKDKSEFINTNGKQVLNFQLSLLLYTLVLAMIVIPIIIITIFNSMPLNTIFRDPENIINHLSLENITGIVLVGAFAILLFIGLKLTEFFLIIYASVKTSNGEEYNYPFSIPFIK